MIKIVGLCGKAGSGKSTVAHHILKHYDVVPISFADPLRNMLHPIIDQLYYNDTEASANQFLRERKEEVIEQLGTSPRKLLQDIGALMRSHNEDTFVNLAQSKIDMIEEIDALLGRVLSLGITKKMSYIIDDLRYDNEACWIDQSNGLIFRINRPEEYLRKVPAHHSENGVSDVFIDHEMQNDNNPETVVKIAEEIAQICQLRKSIENPIIDPKGSNRVH